MKSKTIWESASRPIFVRSVWLESPSHEGRGVQHRHFILDYESQQHFQQRRQQPLRSNSLSPVRCWTRDDKDNLRHSVSYELSESSGASSESQVSAENNLLQIGSAKIKLQQPISRQTRQRLRLIRLHRRPSLTKQIRKPVAKSDYERNSNWKLREIYSRHSSLQDLPSTLSMASYLYPEERLAERVLNWLDLAGKSGLMKNQEYELPIEIMETKNITQHHNYERQKQQRKQQEHQPQQIQQQQQQYSQPQRRKLQPHSQFQGSMLTSTKKRSQNPVFNRDDSVQSLDQMKASTRHQCDGAKPITIIFNRDGFPVRLNRAARNIDLCTLASSADTARRLAGSLASVRLYHGNEGISHKSRLVRANSNLGSGGIQQQSTTTRSLSRTRPPRISAENAEKSITATQTQSQKRFQDDFGVNQAHDSKRQLHIFMPSLPKKGIISNSSSLLSAAGCDGGGEESAVSLLSQQLYESCKL